MKNITIYPNSKLEVELNGVRFPITVHKSLYNYSDKNEPAIVATIIHEYEIEITFPMRALIVDGTPLE